MSNDLEPGDYILAEPAGANAMVLGFTKNPDGTLAHVWFGRQDAMNGIRLMEKLGVDSRNFGPAAEPVAVPPDEPTED